MARKSVAGTPADPTTVFTPLVLDGKTYHLLFDFNSIADCEATTGVNLLKALEFHSLDARQYRGVLFAATRKAHPELTLEDVGNLIKLDQLKLITNALIAAWCGSNPEKTENPPKPDADPA